MAHRWNLTFAAAIAAVVITSASAAVEPFLLISTDQSIWKFSLDGKPIERFVERGYVVDQPQHMAIGGDGNLYVANYGSHKVEVFGMDGTHVRTVNTGAEIQNPAWMTIRDDRLIVSSLATSRVVQYDLSDNDRLLGDLVTPFVGFNSPHGIHWTDEGNMLVSTSRGIERFDADGNHIDRFAKDGLDRPLQIHDAGDRYIVSNFFGDLQQLDKTTGESLGILNSDGIGSGSDGVIALPTGETLVAFNVSSQVRWYGADGTILGNFASRTELAGEGPNGMLLVVPTPGVLVAFGFAAPLMTRRRR